MTLHVGTSGYSYKEWKRCFYPDKLPAKSMLEYYGTQLPAVEINNTFYRLPKTSVLENWREQVPPDFRFSVKASRRITHMKRIKDAAEETTYLLDTVRALGDRLGVVLFQLPPNLKKDMERLEPFVALLRDDIRSVFEFRHESWLDDEVYDCLRAHQCAICLSDVDDAPDPPLIETTTWGYLRLRRPDYDAKSLKTWAKRIADTNWGDTFVFFKHEDEGSGPRMAREFLDVAGDG